MSKDIRVIFKGDPSDAVAATKVIEKAGTDTAKQLERDFQTLGAKTTAAFEAKRQAATSAYDRIKASGLASTEELARAEKALAARFKEVDQEQAGVKKSTNDLSSAYGALASALAAVGIGAFVSQMVGARVEFDKIRASLSTTFGSASGSEFAFVAAEADRLGLSLVNTATEYGRLSAASKGTIMEGQGTRDIFLGIAEAGTALGLSSEEMSGTLNAVQQMMSKGKVQAEELRGQLGERLPGAFKMAADAMGITQAQLNKMLDNGEVLATDLLPKLAAALHEKFGKAATEAAGNVQGQLNRLDTAWKLLQTTASEELPIAETLGLAADSVKMLTKHLDAAAVGFTAMGVAAGAHAIITNIGAITLAVRALATSTALATGGISLLAGAAAIAGYEGGKALSEMFSDGETAASDHSSASQKRMDELTQKAEKARALSAASYEKEAAAQKKAAEAASKALDTYSKQVDDLGRSQLEAAKSGFSKDLERQEEYFKKSGQAAANLSAPIQNYLGVLDKVAAAQKKAHEDIKGVLDKIGAGKVASLQQDINIATSEKTWNEARLTAWKSYYDKLWSMHATAVDRMKVKQAEALAVKQSGLDFQKELDNKFSAAPTGESQYDQVFLDLSKIDAANAAAMQLTGEARIKGLQAAMNLLKALPQEIKDGDTILISSIDMKEKAASRFREMQAALQSVADAEVAAAKTSADTIKTEMQKAQDAMAVISADIDALDAKILALNKQIILTMPTDQVNDAAKKIQGYLDAIKDKTITITANYVSNIPSSLSGASSFGGVGSIGVPLSDISTLTPHAGTSYVPRSGLYSLARGEQILNRNETSAARAGNQTVTIAPVIYLSGVSASGAEKTARELARELEPELRKLANHYR